MQMKRCELKLKGNCKYILKPAVFQNRQVNCSLIEWPMFAMLLVLPTVCYTYFLLFVFPMLFPIF